MTYPCLYHTRNKRQLHKARLEIVLYAKKHSIRAAARHFGVSRNTIRLWYRRYKKNPKQFLYDRRSTEVTHPHRMSDDWIQLLKEIIAIKQRYKQRLIISHIKEEYDIPYSVKTILKTLKKLGLYKRKAQKKTHRQQEARIWKKTLHFCQKIQVDIKFLTDIPELLYSLQTFFLPKYQITARDVATGALWVCFATEKSSTNAALFIEYLLTHLAFCDCDTSSITVQTDNGTEFVSGPFSTKTSPFSSMVSSFQVRHTTIPPASPTYNSDVEASHKLIENECYATMCNPDKKTFLQQSADYVSWFNLTRYNTYKEGSPLQLLTKRFPTISTKVLSLAPCIVDTLLTKEKLDTWHTHSFSV